LKGRVEEWVGMRKNWDSHKEVVGYVSRKGNVEKSNANGGKKTDVVLLK